MLVTKQKEVAMSCEEANSEAVDGIEIDIQWSKAEMVVASVVVLISNIKTRICG